MLVKVRWICNECKKAMMTPVSLLSNDNDFHCVFVAANDGPVYAAPASTNWFDASWLLLVWMFCHSSMHVVLMQQKVSMLSHHFSIDGRLLGCWHG